MMTETQLERQLCDYITLKGFDVFKIPRTGVYDTKSKTYRSSNNPYSKRSVGHSDLVLLAKGTSIYLEVKLPLGRQSEVQKKFQKLVEQNGCSYHVVRCVEDVDTIIGGLSGNAG